MLTLVNSFSICLSHYCFMVSPSFWLGFGGIWLGGAPSRVCVPMCIADRYEEWGNGRKRGDEGGITTQLRNKSKIMLVILSLLPT